MIRNMVPVPQAATRCLRNRAASRRIASPAILMLRFLIRKLSVVFVAAALAAGASAANAPKPASVARFAAAEAAVEQAVADGQIPGAVLLVGHDGEVVFRKAFGARMV